MIPTFWRYFEKILRERLDVAKEITLFYSVLEWGFRVLFSP